MTLYMPTALLSAASGPQTRSPINNIDLPQKEELRHILLGSPSAIRQVIHQLHTLHYVDPTLWSPITAISDRLVITPEQGEAISLLRRSL